MGVSASFGVDYDPAAGAAGNDHDAVATKTATQGSGMGAVVKLSHDSGLTIGAGIEEITRTQVMMQKLKTLQLTLYTLWVQFLLVTKVTTLTMVQLQLQVIVTR